MVAEMVPLSTGSRWRSPRKLVFPGNGLALVPLTRGYVATVDEADAAAIAGWNWSADVCPRRKAVYAKRTARTPDGPRIVLLHRFLWSAWGNDPADEIDHRDRDGLNCRRGNLRAATVQLNAANRAVRVNSESGLKGVRFIAKAGKWRAQFGADGHDRHLGLFDTAAEASAAYNRAAVARFGEFARAA